MSESSSSINSLESIQGGGSDDYSMHKNIIIGIFGSTILLAWLTLIIIINKKSYC